MTPSPAVTTGGAGEPSFTPPTAATSTPATALQPPAVVPGELSRRVVSRKDGHLDSKSTLHRSARKGHEYGIQAACTSTTSGTALSVEVRSGKPGAADVALATGTIPCDGTVTVNGVGTLPAEPILVYLHGDQSGVPSAYAILAPVSALPAAG
ncbi:MAG TPA: hypothetical protein VN408_16860 [Actinoplanes sp.]|nr:hypothetical protein [Actinoplanes sp.]